MTEHEALAEMMAEAASNASGEGEAEAMVGAAVVTVLSPRDRRALSALLPDLLRGTAVLTRILRRHPRTRALVKTVPGIMRRSVRQLKRGVHRRTYAAGAGAWAPGVRGVGGVPARGLPTRFRAPGAARVGASRICPACGGMRAGRRMCCCWC